MGLPMEAFGNWSGYLAAHGATQRELGEANLFRLKALMDNGHSHYRDALDYQNSLTGLQPRKPAPRPRAKCDSCGSREFREHNGHTVCAYCRGGA